MLSLIFVFSCGEDKNQNSTNIPKINVIKVRSENVPTFSDYVGQIYGIRDIPIRARVDGFLQGVYFKEGRQIEKGTLLYSIDPQPFEANLALKRSIVSEANTGLAFASSEYDRIKPLAEMNAVSKSDLDGAIARKKASEAEVSAAEASLKIAQIDLDYCKIYAPISGIIGKTMAREGEYVGRSPNPVILTTISQIETIRVQFFLTESEYLAAAKKYLDTDQSNKPNKKLELSLILSDGSEHNHKGLLNFIDRGVDPATGTILVEATFPNTEMILRPGQFARVRIKSSDDMNELIVPQRCVSELQGNYSVFIVNKENKIEARQIEIGNKYDDYFVVKKGLKENEKVILEGLQKVGAGMVIEPVIVEFENQKKF
ncbi:efflux RND transporter periplasmic adaptor subunit [Namhaeicola litoreus]|uniref:Efflux RND transporter periplasmic adaptor subunit n=1 Tax=Namhaeicola litoreus TaxID=1052145 RepID=A0ABW3Y1S6_9FLAO